MIFLLHHPLYSHTLILNSWWSSLMQRGSFSLPLPLTLFPSPFWTLVPFFVQQKFWWLLLFILNLLHQLLHFVCLFDSQTLKDKVAPFHLITFTFRVNDCWLVNFPFSKICFFHLDCSFCQKALPQKIAFLSWYWSFTLVWVGFTNRKGRQFFFYLFLLPTRLFKQLLERLYGRFHSNVLCWTVLLAVLWQEFWSSHFVCLWTNRSRRRYWSFTNSPFMG